jgi:hypothetical protein
MTNLEKLDLSFVGSITKSFIDGNNLKQNVIYRIPLLKKFTFNICSIWLYSPMNIPSNQDIQQTFKDFKDVQIISSVDYFQQRKYSQCLVYSYPYKLEHYYEITNHFPDGLFRCVREISLYDEYPFEHEFFLRIGQSFPFVEKITLINRKKQINKRIQNLSIVEYPHLINLDLSEAHQDYHEQFLFDTKTCLPNNLRVQMNYQSVKKVTRNFRRNTTRCNCTKIIHVLFSNKFNFFEHLKDHFPEHLKDYFPNAYIC